MKRLFTFYLIILLSSFCYGMGNPPEDTTPETAYNVPIPAIDEIDKIDVIVKGMTCAMCAQGIEKNLLKIRLSKLSMLILIGTLLALCVMIKKLFLIQ